MKKSRNIAGLFFCIKYFHLFLSLKMLHPQNFVFYIVNTLFYFVLKMLQEDFFYSYVFFQLLFSLPHFKT